MSDWKKFFEQLEGKIPAITCLPEDVKTTFWEDLYQAFKYRYSHEQDEALRALMKARMEEEGKR